jgi:hypothetical protein
VAGIPFSYAYSAMANDSDFHVLGALDRFKVEFADEVNLAGGEDHDGNLLQGWDIDWGCTDSSYW